MELYQICKRGTENVLTYDEYEIISSAEDDDDIPVKVKFKIVEFFRIPG